MKWGALTALVGCALALASACDGRLDFEDVAGPGAAGGFGGDDDGGKDRNDCPIEACTALDLTCDDGYPCVECLEHSDCENAPSSRPRCDKFLQRCVGCTDDDDCRDGVCDPETRECVEPCDPNDGEFECDEDEYCHPQKWICVGCFEDKCATSSSFKPYCSESGTRCVECTKDFHCPNDDEYWCDPVLFECVACRDSDDCFHGKICDPKSHECTSALDPTHSSAR